VQRVGEGASLHNTKYTVLDSERGAAVSEQYFCGLPSQ